MRKYWKTLILATVVLSTTALAGTGGATQGACSPQEYALRKQFSAPAIDPYGYMLPSNLNMSSQEISNSYQIELKSFKADDMSKYQFKTVDNRGLGAGYTSPYLWEVGRGPGDSMLSPYGAWGSPMDGRAYSPIPMPGR